MRFLPVNLNALLVELDDLAQTLKLLASLQREPIAGVEELVPAARTILVQFRPSAVSFAALVEALAGRDLGGAERRAGALVEIPVHYDGEDLDEVAALLGIDRAELVRRHGGSVYSVAFTGFAPGFAYLAGGDASLDVPRRQVPRTRIPAGAVGLAGRFSGVYPQASPGGWQIIGRTPLAMWDIQREPPALLQPGQRVRFIDLASRPALAEQLAQAGRDDAATAAPPRRQVAAGVPALEVVAAGLQTLFQDLGRAGQAGQGVAASGAMDRGALRAANRLVGNAAGEPALESVGGGLQLRARGELVLAVTGAAGPIRVSAADGRCWNASRHQPLALADGDLLTLDAPEAGLRSYVAVRGGFDLAPVLGSGAFDTLAQVGPAPVVAGDALALRAAPAHSVVGAPEAAPVDLPDTRTVVTLDIVLGPRTDWFTEAAVQLLSSQDWQVTPQSNRVGIRLQGEQALARAITGELPSEGTALGAIQVPPSGQPVLFLADHPLTGGYPVIAAVAPYHLDRAGQIPVGATLRLRPVADFVPVVTASRDDPS